MTFTLTPVSPFRFRMPIVALTLQVLSTISAAGCGVSGHLVATSATLGNRSPDAGHLVVLRVSQVAGAAVTVPVAIDGSSVAELGTGEYADFEVEPGPHLVAVGFLGRELTERVQVDPNGTYYFRFHFEVFNPAGLDFIERPSPSEGARDVASGKYTKLSATR